MLAMRGTRRNGGSKRPRGLPNTESTTTLTVGAARSCLYAVLCPAAEVVVNADAAKAAGIGSG